MRIVVDSSANLDRMEGAELVSVPLIIQIGEQTWRDTPELSVASLLRALDDFDGPTGTACPAVGEWLRAFGQEEQVFCLTLTGALSGCYGSAVAAAGEYMEAHPDRRVDVMDSATTGPELELLAEALASLTAAGKPFVCCCDEIRAYKKRTHLGFMLSSLENFARNGRVNPTLARLIAMLHVHIVGRASAEGTLEPLKKCRGQLKALEQLWSNMKASGYAGGKVRIRHTENPVAAVELRRQIREEFPSADVQIGENRGLCSYYAEHGGILVGYEEGTP